MTQELPPKTYLCRVLLSCGGRNAGHIGLKFKIRPSVSLIVSALCDLIDDPNLSYLPWRLEDFRAVEFSARSSFHCDECQENLFFKVDAPYSFFALLATSSSLVEPFLSK